MLLTTGSTIHESAPQMLAMRGQTISVSWNTGRGYSVSGQRISAMVLADGKVAFYDVDREIGGVTTTAFPQPFEIASNERIEVTLRHFVLAQYDHGRYTHDFYDYDHAAIRTALRNDALAVAAL